MPLAVAQLWLRRMSPFLTLTEWVERDLALRFENSNDYATAKTDFIEAIKTKARAERRG